MKKKPVGEKASPKVTDTLDTESALFEELEELKELEKLNGMVDQVLAYRCCGPRKVTLKPLKSKKAVETDKAATKDTDK